MVSAMAELARGAVVWADLDPGRSGAGATIRPVLVVASDLYLARAAGLAIVLPTTTTDRGWPHHVRLRGIGLMLREPAFALTEQPRTLTRDRLGTGLGVVDVDTLRAVYHWLRDFLAPEVPPPASRKLPMRRQRG